MTKTPELRAADIARELKVSPREARMKLRAAGFRAPYAAKDLPKMKAVIKGPAPDKPKADTAKPKAKGKPKAPVSKSSEPTVEAPTTIN